MRAGLSRLSRRFLSLRVTMFSPTHCSSGLSSAALSSQRSDIAAASFS